MAFDPEIQVVFFSQRCLLGRRGESRGGTVSSVVARDGNGPGWKRETEKSRSRCCLAPVVSCVTAKRNRDCKSHPTSEVADTARLLMPSEFVATPVMMRLLSVFRMPCFLEAVGVYVDKA